MVCSSTGEEVGDESTSLSHPHLVALLHRHLRRLGVLDWSRVARWCTSTVTLAVRVVGLIAIQCVLARHRQAVQFPRQGLGAVAVADALAFRAAWERARWPRVEGVVRISVGLGGHPSEWRTDLVVRQVALARVWEQRQDRGDSSCACSFACAQSDEQLHEVIVDLAATGLHDVHILVTDAVANLDTSLTIRELLQLDVGGRDSEVGADVLGELRVRGTAEDHDVADHGGLRCRSEV